MNKISFERTVRAFTGSLVAAAAIAVGIAACKPGGPTDPGPDPDPGPNPQGFSITLEWTAPTVDAEGAPLEDLAGYMVHYRSSSPANGAGATTVETGMATRATITGIPAGTWQFGVTARDAAGNESELSNEVQIEVGP